MTDKQDLIREIHEYVTTHGGENTATHLLVQAASAIQTQAAELEAVGAGGVQALSAAPAGWRELAAKVMDALADAQDTTNSQYPEHVRCYPSWERHARWLRWHAYMFRSGNPVGNGAGNPDVLAALAASPTPPAEQPLRWVERWHGSGGKEFWEGWSILNAANREMIAHLGPDVDPDAVRGIVAAHNEALCGECAGTGGRWCPACAGATPTAEQQAAPKAAPVLPEGWTACTIEFGNDGPEEVAYGPQRMMNRLAKWLGKYFARVIADAAPKAAPGEPVHGDVLPPVGSRVYIRHGRDNGAHACTVTGYYAWGDLGGDKRLHRVFVRLVYEGTDTQQARMLCDCHPTAEAALSEAAPQQEAQEPGEIPESIERMATGRYKVVPSHESMFHRWAVVAGSGTQQLYLGREVECQNMARKFAGAFLDGAFVAMQRTAPQPAPAPLSEMPYEKRKAIQEGEQIGASDAWFKARHEMLDTVDRRNVFRAGFDRGWNAALAAQGGK